jgi:hypothetical protein
LCQANANHQVILFCTSLGVRLPRLVKSITCKFESGFVNLAISLDDVNWASSSVGKSGDLLGALVPAHGSGRAVEGLDKDGGLVGGHGKAIVKCLDIKCFAPLLKNS